MTANQANIIKITKAKSFFYAFFTVKIVLMYIYFFGIWTTTECKAEKINILNTLLRKSTLDSTTKLELYKNYTKICTVQYDDFVIDAKTDYSNIASVALHKQKVVKGIVLYFPALQGEYFEPELKWLYRSWLEMLKYEPPNWRTDIIIFIDVTKITTSFFDDLNCKVTNTRTDKQQPPMCTLIPYTAVKDRVIDSTQLDKYNNVEDVFYHLLHEVNVFETNNESEFSVFYARLKELSSYNYVDSILVGFEGYKKLSKTYDFLMRSDIDTFLTPLFAQWLPMRCNDFYVGGGGYSTQFNTKRLHRISNHLKLQNADVQNLGSTWFSTPTQFRLVSYMTLSMMSYVYTEEFSEPERKGAIGGANWPDWHYGVVLLYGQHIALNHLIAIRQINIVKLGNLIDFPSTNEQSIHKIIHIHIFHSNNLFSKFIFKNGQYDNMTMNDGDETKVKFYCLKMALESKRASDTELAGRLASISYFKT